MFPARIDAAPGSLRSPHKPQVSLLPISGSVKAAVALTHPRAYPVSWLLKPSSF